MNKNDSDTSNAEVIQLHTATGNNQAAEFVTDKRGFADRWKFSVRQTDNFLAQGLPHLKIGRRRVRIIVAEGDAWMRDRYFTRRIGPAKQEAGQ